MFQSPNVFFFLANEGTVEPLVIPVPMGFLLICFRLILLNRVENGIVNKKTKAKCFNIGSF